MAGYFFMTPRVGHATQAEIEAAIPAALKVRDNPNPAARARYARLMALTKQFHGLDSEQVLGSSRVPFDPTARREALEKAAPVLRQADAILNEGPLRAEWTPNAEGNFAFPELARSKTMQKVAMMALADAVDRKDRAEAVFYAKFLLRFSKALLDAEGGLIHGLVGVSADAIALRAIYDAEMKNGFDSAGRTTVMAMIARPIDGPALFARYSRREFQTTVMPFLLNPDKLLRDPKTGATAPGTFDPIATARLASRIYVAGIEDLQRPLGTQSGLADKISEEAGGGLPEFRGPVSGSNLSNFLFRVRMNSGTNTIGRQLLGNGSPFQALPDVIARFQTNRNLIESVFLLRSGKSPSLTDYFSGKPLQFDSKRRIVWSVGANRKDDGGDIGKPPKATSPDFGYGY